MRPLQEEMRLAMPPRRFLIAPSDLKRTGIPMFAEMCSSIVAGRAWPTPKAARNDWAEGGADQWSRIASRDFNLDGDKGQG